MNFGQKKRWFTLVEMLIVIVIIWVLAAALIPRLTSVRWRANDVARKADLQQVATAIVSYSMDKWKYPSTWSYSIDKLDLKKYVTVLPKDPTSSYRFPEYWLPNHGTWEYVYVSIKKWWNPNKWFALISRAETEWWANWVYLTWQVIDSNSSTENIVPCTIMTEITATTTSCVYMSGTVSTDPCDELESWNPHPTKSRELCTCTPGSLGSITPWWECEYSTDSQLRYVIAR